jgi:hypothetical protein
MRDAGRRWRVSRDDEGREAVEQYLHEELPEASMESLDIPDGSGYLVRLAAPDFDCDVIVALEFVRDHDVGEIPEILEEWAVSERVRAGGLVIITSSGVTTET